MSVKSIIWSERALNEYEDLFEHLLEKWGEKTALRIEL